MTRKFVEAVSVALTALVCFAAPAGAHHSSAMYDHEKIVTVEGTVKEFSWTNPHVVLWVTSKDEPPQIWFAECTSPGNLMRLGWNKRLFKPGDRVKLEVHPLRNGKYGGSFVSVTLLDTGKNVAIREEDFRKLGEKPPAN